MTLIVKVPGTSSGVLNRDGVAVEEGWSYGSARIWMNSAPMVLLAGVAVFIVGAVLGAMWGVVWGVWAAGDVADDAWWNPVSAWRALQAVEGNIVLQILAPESVVNARAAKGILVTSLAGALGVGATKARQHLVDGQGSRKDGMKKKRVKELGSGFGQEVRTLSARLARTPPRRAHRSRNGLEEEVVVVEEASSPETPEMMTPIRRRSGAPEDSPEPRVLDFRDSVRDPVARELFSRGQVVVRRPRGRHWESGAVQQQQPLTLRAPPDEEPMFVYQHRRGGCDPGGRMRDQGSPQPLRLRMM
jgi:hypothetical protein